MCCGLFTKDEGDVHSSHGCVTCLRSYSDDILCRDCHEKGVCHYRDEYDKRCLYSDTVWVFEI